MKYGSVCSGIEAATVAWHPLGWEPAWFSEIEAFPSAVLKHRFPNVPNLGDMTKIHEKETFKNESIDLLVGGTPCQSFSVAGLRKGLADPRGNLMLTYLAIADRKRPKWLVWENVPGVLSSNGGRDFGAFLTGLAELGYGFAYKVYDAQYFGVAQRRRRVFVVGYLGDWRPAAAVLFERHSLSGHPAPRREKREGAADGIEIGLGGGNFTEVNPTLDARAKDGPIRNQLAGAVITPRGPWWDGGEVAGTVTTKSDDQRMPDKDNAQLVLVDVVPFDTTQITSKMNYSSPQPGDACHPLAATAHPPAIAHAFKVRVGREGGGKGYLGQDEAAFTISTKQDQMVFDKTDLKRNALNDTFTYKGLNYASTQKRNSVALLSVLRQKIGTKSFAQWGLGVFNSLQSSQILQSDLYGIGIRPASFSDSRFIYCSTSRQEDYSSWLLQSLREAGCEGCASQGLELSEQFTGELRAYLQKLPYERASAKRLMQDLWEADEGEGLLRKALSAVQEIRRPDADKDEPTHTNYAIRRLTPVETEILQGFPMGWTRIPYRNKPADQCPDGPRYKACGNSMAVPVMRWIGERIEMVEQLRKGL